MGDVNSVIGALTTALSDWSATIGGTTAVIIRSESTLATTSEEARRIAGWRRTRETGSGFLAELLSAVSNITGSLDGWAQITSGNSLSYQCAFIATADAWLVLHANCTTNTPSNANAASIAH